MAVNDTEKVNRVCEAIRETAMIDIVSLAEVRQLFGNQSCSQGDFPRLLKCVLLRVLKTGLEIGHAVNKTGNYVEFIEWKGDPEAKIQRAVALIANDSQAADFGVWLALRSNVDRYELDREQL